MRINVVHAMPHSSSAFGIAEDGFTAAMELVGNHHDVRWLNVHPHNPGHEAEVALVRDADFVLVRSDWGWLPCQAADRALFRHPEVPVGLVIAGSSPAPPLVAQQRFDVLFYETPWYAPFVAEHPRAVEAFGIDTRVMRDMQHPEREWDWLMVGRFAAFKRPEALLAKRGRRLAIGDMSGARPELIESLVAGGIEVRDQTTQEGLAELYNRSKRVLVPCTLQGGGERAVWEARACGCAVETAPDNPKLASLLRGPVAGHEHYAALLLAGIEQAAESPLDPSLKLAGQRLTRWNVWSDKLRRSPATVRIRAAAATSRLRAPRTR
jgi:hypothetical protein